MINARSETVDEKPSFRRAFAQRRCLVLADGYFEWKKVGSQKQPYWIRRADELPFAMAGLWESWRGGSALRLNEPMLSCTILTTSANEATSAIHDRMPVILDDEAISLWLQHPDPPANRLMSLLQPYASDALTIDPVSRYVNNARNDDPACVERVH
jgi:putative SOS response-associated peptidase YedK